MQLLPLNNWTTILAGAVLADDLALTIDPDKAALLIGLGSGDHYTITAVETLGPAEISREIIKVTGALGGVLTVERAQEGTSARAWPAGTALEMRLTAGVLDALIPSPSSGGAFGTPRLPINSTVCPFDMIVGGNTSYSSSYIYLMPFELAYPMTIDQVGIRIQVANASASVRVALYSAGEDGWPDARIDLVPIPATPAGHQVAALGAPVALEPGRLYWFAVQPLGGSVSLVNVGSRALGMTITGSSARILKRFTGAAPPFTWVFDVADLETAVDAPPFVSIRRSA